MSGKTITPSLGAKSFTCPHCGAMAHQHWYSVFVREYDKDNAPSMPDPDIIQDIEKNDDLDAENRRKLVKLFQRLLAKELFRQFQKDGIYLQYELNNLYVSLCYSCSKLALWVADSLLYPAQATSIQPNEEIPPDIRVDFLEASSIVDKSPRGAAALLRLCIQKLMAHLGLKGKSIDEDIGELVKRGLDSRIQKALDVVRVIGNNAVHPGQIDLRDDKASAIKLFDVVNLIVEAMIATPKHIEKMYSELPEGARKAIEKRDGKE
jgi:hypothetical protein